MARKLREKVMWEKRAKGLGERLIFKCSAHMHDGRKFWFKFSGMSTVFEVRPKLKLEFNWKHDRGINLVHIIEVVPHPTL